MTGRAMLWSSLIMMLGGCAGAQLAVPVADKLAFHGLGLGTDVDLPAEMREHALSLRVHPTAAALPHDPAGYWIVGLNGEECDRPTLLRALEEWQRGDKLRLRVRRDPRYQPTHEWWERDVILVGTW